MQTAKKRINSLRSAVSISSMFLWSDHTVWLFFMRPLRLSLECLDINLHFWVKNLIGVSFSLQTLCKFFLNSFFFFIDQNEKGT